MGATARRLYAVASKSLLAAFMVCLDFLRKGFWTMTRDDNNIGPGSRKIMQAAHGATRSTRIIYEQVR